MCFFCEKETWKVLVDSKTDLAVFCFQTKTLLCSYDLCIIKDFYLGGRANHILNDFSLFPKSLLGYF